MSTTTTHENAGRILAERLGLTIIGTEGHDLVCGCIACTSSDAMRIHQDEGVAQCFSCGKAWSPFDLCKVVLNGDKAAAVRLMVDTGLFEEQAEPSPNGNGKAAEAGPGVDDAIEAIAKLKSCTKAGLLAYGAKAWKGGVAIPMFGPASKEDSWTLECTRKNCSYIHITPDNGKGYYLKGKPTGLFLPKDDRGVMQGDCTISHSPIRTFAR